MTMDRFMRGLIAMSGALFLCILVFSPLIGGAVGAPSPANPGQAASPADIPAEQVYKNIQALKGMPASQMHRVMTLIAASMGMRCDQCHIPDAFEKDDRRAKQTARTMIQMAMDLNKTSFEGQPQVTCYTCHRGQEQPVGAPPVGQPAAPAAAPPLRPSMDGVPTFDQIADKYIQAAGGSAAFDKLKTRVMKGVSTDGRGGSYPVEVLQVAPNKMIMTTTLPNGSNIQGYDGTTGWAVTLRGPQELTGPDLGLLKRAADFSRPLKVREECLSPRVMGKVKLGDQEAYTVTGRADGMRVQLWFDTRTGLLMRRRITIATVLGAFPEQTDYEDYRDVDGVKVPFVVRTSSPDLGASTTITYKEITHDKPVDESRFTSPIKK